jgi:hypothetical protein
MPIDTYSVPILNASLNAAVAFRCMQCPSSISAQCRSGLVEVSNAWVYVSSSEDAKTVDVQAVQCPANLCGTNRTCASGRKDWAINPLCGQCKDGYSEWRYVISPL